MPTASTHKGFQYMLVPIGYYRSIRLIDLYTNNIFRTSKIGITPDGRTRRRLSDSIHS